MRRRDDRQSVIGPRLFTHQFNPSPTISPGQLMGTGRGGDYLQGLEALQELLGFVSVLLLQVWDLLPRTIIRLLHLLLLLLLLLGEFVLEEDEKEEEEQRR